MEITMHPKRKPGRPKKVVPVKASHKYRSVGLEINIAEQLDVIKNNLYSQFGFKPSYSDVIRYLLKLSETK
jgi:hypothetical protein